MAQLEWYKKKANHRQMSFYDCYKNNRTKTDQDAVMHQRFITTYWKQTIELQSERKSQTCRWPYTGMNYRRMVEPLDIAEFYRVKGRRGYISNGRSRHYAKLEELLVKLGNANNNSIDSRRENVDAILTEDSCFWALVEETFSCECLGKMDCSDAEKDLSMGNLIEFEKYVLKLIKNYAVSPEIFLTKSSFMEWWRQYEEIKGPCSSLTEIMKTSRYLLYAKGELEV